MAQAQMSKAI